LRALRRIEPQVLIALVCIVALEGVFAAMARLGDLSLHIPEFMALALGGGVLYFIALYALEHTRDNRTVLWFVLLGALFNLSGTLVNLSVALVAKCSSISNPVADFIRERGKV